MLFPVFLGQKEERKLNAWAWPTSEGLVDGLAQFDVANTSEPCPLVTKWLSFS